MTHYWWMHWFWITLCFSDSNCQVPTATLHSISTNRPFIKKETSGSYHYPNVLGGFLMNPPINVNTSNTSQYNLTHINNGTKLHKPSVKKVDIFLSNVTMKQTTSKVNLNKETTVIDQNTTDTNLNVTDNQTLINTSFNSINSMENITYIGEDTGSNSSLIFNSERIAVGGNESSGNFSAAGITGITLGCVVIVGIVCAVSYFLYRNRGFNRPQVLNDRCSNPDSSGYIDDASVRDNSEEMYSLDNDSFLNSLEAMTIQNYWTDTVKHTKL